MKIKVAGYVFEVFNRYPYCEQFMKDYLTDEAADCTIEITDEDLTRSADISPKGSLHYREYIEIYRKICDFITLRDGILMHGAVISFDNKAYMFTAPSGTGKTTHIRQWKKAFGNRVGIVNGDKPIIRYQNGEFFAYGTPWCGKEHYNSNLSLPLKGIVLLGRGEENTIEEIHSAEFTMFLLRQIYLPKSPIARSKVLDFADKLFSTVPMYHLKCNISPEAAIVAKEKIHKEGAM